jgi:hypothetical protein
MRSWDALSDTDDRLLNFLPSGMQRVRLSALSAAVDMVSHSQYNYCRFGFKGGETLNASIHACAASTDRQACMLSHGKRTQLVCDQQSKVP